MEEKNEAEFEFLIEGNNYIYPIDVKKRKKQMNSVDKYRQHNKKSIVIKISKNNYGYDANNKILTIPLYEVFLILDDIINNTLLEQNV